jgi:hypothetical protein
VRWARCIPDDLFGAGAGIWEYFALGEEGVTNDTLRDEGHGQASTLAHATQKFILHPEDRAQFFAEDEACAEDGDAQ